NQPNYLFLLRPRRFGKSLFLAMLETYYSVDYADRFEELFGELYIGKHATKAHNKYLVLRFNFSEVSSNPDEVEQSFKAYCNAVIIRFIKKYEHLLGKEIWEELDREEKLPGLQLGKIARYISDNNCPHIYLLIDEYDNFTNTLLATYGTERYRKTTHGEGFIREFFNVIKAATTGPDAAIDRMFITGVSPVTMDDVTSGFNIGTNISMKPEFNSIIGFSTEEVRQMISYYKSEGALPEEVTVDDLLEEMRPWYDNYCFSEDMSDEHMFNSDMSLYFLNEYMQRHKPPKMMVDSNIRTDYNKLRHLVQIDKRLGVNTSVIQQLVAEGKVTANIAQSFPAERMVDTENFKSLLFYFGMLSIQGVYRSSILLGIPNLTVREQLYTYLIEAYRNSSIFNVDMEHFSYLVEEMAYNGDWQPVFQYFAKELERQSAIREFIEG
ncbi:AAA family ATPase, partial [Bacteroides sp. ET489]|uniref:AAA family ATPase n=1 Tax=Bacteroides sp. ET489 TaxID=3057126 RepID=UPI002671E1A3